VRSLLYRFAKTTQFWQDNRLVLREARRFPGLAMAVVVLPICIAVFEGFGIGSLLVFLQTLVSPDAAPMQTGIEWFDVWVLGIRESKMSQLFRVSGLILGTSLIRSGFNYFSGYSTEVFRLRIVNRLQTRIFEQLQALSLSFFGQIKMGDILNTLTAEIEQLKMSIGLLSFLFTRCLVLSVYAVVVLLISWQLSIVAILLFLLAGVGVSTLNRKVREASFPISQARSNLTAIASEFLGGIKTVQTFASQDYERTRFYRASQEVLNTSSRIARRSSLVRPLTEAAATCILVGMIVAGVAIFVQSGQLQIASLLTFFFILSRLVPAIQDVNTCFTNLNAAQGSVRKIEDLLDTTDKPYLQNGHRRFDGLQRSLEFVAVTFGYTPSEPVLKDITLTIEKGQTVALVGSSGAGKSTLADLIPRLYDPTEGEVLLDGVNLREFDIRSVRQKMAVVSQDTFIFNATVKENIAYALDQVDVADVIEAAKQANAWGFIEEMPEGLDTVLGDRGVRLSGGQRQRIAIARALLRNPDILILDEATSALDSVSERLIQESLEKLSVGRTVIAIAHRLSTIANADKVVVMEQGKIIEQGTYQELLALRGKLWNYHQIQNSAHSGAS